MPSLKEAPIVLGKIVAAQGILGAVKVLPFADDPAAWGRLKTWYVGQEGCALESWRAYRVEKARLHNKTLVAQFSGVSDRNQAETLRGFLVAVPREDLAKPSEGEYYWHDLIGLSVVNTQGELLGKVRNLLEAPANTVFEVFCDAQKDEKPQTLLIPFVNQFVLNVDLSEKKITVNWEKAWSL